MATVFKVISCICLTLVLTSVLQAKEWRGIVPLHSTRADVARLVGQCSDAELHCHFNLDGEEVYIVFSSKDRYVDDCVRQLPPDVVILIQVNPKAELQLSNLKVDLSRFRKFEFSSPPGIGYEGYVDEEEGIIYDTYKGSIIQVEYIAERKDKSLCPTYYEKHELFVSKIADPPVLDVNCPAGVAADGRGTLWVDILGGDPKVTPTFKWNLSSGKIVSGQGTSSIVIETQKSSARFIKATVDVDGYVITLEESCEIQIIRKGEDNKKPFRGTP